MNRKITKILILFLLLNCKNSNSLENNKFSLNQLTERSDLSEGSGLHFLGLKFGKLNEFEFRYSSEGWNWYTKGKYSIKDTKLSLIADFCEDNFGKQNCNDSFGNGFCQINQNVDSIEFLYKLDCYSEKDFNIFDSSSEKSKKISFDIKEVKINSGTEKIYSNIPIITLGNTLGRVLEPVVLREGPGLEFKKTDYVVNIYDGPYLNSLPKDESVIVHARTRQKYQVKNWNNYWLLISSGDTKKVWAFGEFISY